MIEVILLRVLSAVIAYHAAATCMTPPKPPLAVL